MAWSNTRKMCIQYFLFKCTFEIIISYWLNCAAINFSAADTFAFETTNKLFEQTVFSLRFIVIFKRKCVGEIRFCFSNSHFSVRSKITRRRTGNQCAMNGFLTHFHAMQTVFFAAHSRHSSKNCFIAHANWLRYSSCHRRMRISSFASEFFASL